MMIAEEYLNRSRLFRRLKNSAHGQLFELYAVHLVEVGLADLGIWRSLNVVRDLLDWMAIRRTKLTCLDERVVDRYLQHRGGKQTIQPGDRAALNRWLLILRAASSIPPVALPTSTPQEQIFTEFSDYLRSECGLAERTILRHLPAIRRFLCEVCPAGAADLGKIRQEEVTRYIERHAQDWSPRSGKGMCWSLRAFCRYLHHAGLNPLALAGCVPSIRQWKLVNLPTYLDGRFDSLVLPHVNTECMQLFIAEIGRRYPGENIVMVVDGAGWHQSKNFALPENLRLHFLRNSPVNTVLDEVRDQSLISSSRS